MIKLIKMKIQAALVFSCRFEIIFDLLPVCFLLVWGFWNEKIFYFSISFGSHSRYCLFFIFL